MSATGVSVITVGTVLLAKTEVRDMVGKRLAEPGDRLRIVSTESSFYRYYVQNERTAETFGVDGGELDMNGGAK